MPRKRHDEPNRAPKLSSQQISDSEVTPTKPHGPPTDSEPERLTRKVRATRRPRGDCGPTSSLPVPQRARVATAAQDGPVRPRRGATGDERGLLCVRMCQYLLGSTPPGSLTGQWPPVPTDVAAHPQHNGSGRPRARPRRVHALPVMRERCARSATSVCASAFTPAPPSLWSRSLMQWFQASRIQLA
jgi:hypothetical protein